MQDKVLFGFTTGVIFLITYISIFTMYFRSFFPKRDIGMAARIAVTVLWFGIGVAGCTQDILYIRVGCVLVSTVFATWILYEVTLLKSALMNMLLYGMMAVFEVIIMLIFAYVFHRNLNAEESSFMTFSLGYLSQVFGIIFVFIMRYVWKKKYMNELSEVNAAGFIVLPLFSILTGTLFYTNFTFKMTKAQNAVVIFLFVGLLTINLLTFEMIRKISEHERHLREARIMAERADSTARLYKERAENYELWRMRNHEFKNRITTIGMLARSGEYDKLLNYIDSVGEDYRSDRTFYNTGNIIVDNILNMKYEEMEKADITFIPRLSDLSDLEIADDDLVILLSNLLDNAIEACMRCEGSREISLKFVKEENSTILAVSNTTNGQSIMRNGRYISTKDDPDEHGIGMKNIIRIIEKYKGDYTIEDKDGRFSFYILIERT